jgi:hypothetical protein
MRCSYKNHYVSKSSFKGHKTIEFTVQCEKEKGHEGWCNYDDEKSSISWKAEEVMIEKEKLDQYLSMLMRYCEDKYAYRTEIPEILDKIRGMIK